jgi:hypothetical protein
VIWVGGGAAIIYDPRLDTIRLMAGDTFDVRKGGDASLGVLDD